MFALDEIRRTVSEPTLPAPPARQGLLARAETVAVHDFQRALRSPRRIARPSAGRPIGPVPTAVKGRRGSVNRTPWRRESGRHDPTRARPETRRRRWRRRTSRPVRRVLCPSRRGASGGGHPSRPAVAGRLQRPTRRLGRAALKRLRRSPPRGGDPLGLAPGGVYLATPVTRSAGGLLPHRFTLTAAVMPPWRSVFCGTVPRVTPGCR